MNTDVHEYVSKSKRSCTVYLYWPKGAGNSIVPPATSRFFTYRGGVSSALTPISEGTLYKGSLKRSRSKRTNVL